MRSSWVDRASHAGDGGPGPFLTRAERRPFLLENPYLDSGAGGLILLRAMRTLRRFEARLDGFIAMTLDTHPDANDRVARFDSVAVLKPVEFAALRNFRTTSLRIMDAVDTSLEVALKELTPASLREIQRLRFE